MYHEDHVMQLAIVRIDTFTQFSWIESLFMWIGASHKLCSAGPLYKVMIVTPANDIKVPRILAIPRGLFTSTTSILHQEHEEYWSWNPF